MVMPSEEQMERAESRRGEKVGGGIGGVSSGSWRCQSTDATQRVDSGIVSLM